MGNSPYTRERLAEAVAVSTNWTDLLRRLGLPENGGRRRTLQQRVAEFELDTSHFKQRSPWKKYPDSAIAAAVKTSGSLREVVTALGVPPASGTLTHRPSHRRRQNRRQPLPRLQPHPGGSPLHHRRVTGGSSFRRQHPWYCSCSGNARRRSVPLRAGEPAAEAWRRHLAFPQRAPGNTRRGPEACGPPMHQLRGRHAGSGAGSQRHQPSPCTTQNRSAEAGHEPFRPPFLDGRASIPTPEGRANDPRRQTARIHPRPPRTTSPRTAGGRRRVLLRLLRQPGRMAGAALHAPDRSHQR